MKTTEDEAVFGKSAWIYCRQHVRPHLTGWCGVGCHDKIGLGITGSDKDAVEAAYDKCREWEFPIYTNSMKEVSE